MAYQDTMVELHGCGVFEYVAPPLRAIFGCIVWREELILGRYDALAHIREFVVDQTSIKACNKGT